MRIACSAWRTCQSCHRPLRSSFSTNGPCLVGERRRRRGRGEEEADPPHAVRCGLRMDKARPEQELAELLQRDVSFSHAADLTPQAGRFIADVPQRALFA